jgi:hypothetical protein
MPASRPAPLVPLLTLLRCSFPDLGEPARLIGAGLILVDGMPPASPRRAHDVRQRDSPGLPEPADVGRGQRQPAGEDHADAHHLRREPGQRVAPHPPLADWRRAHALDPGNFAPVYSSAFLLEREGRLAEAAEAWRHIADYATEQGWELTAAWPRRELERILRLLERRKAPGH